MKSAWRLPVSRYRCGTAKCDESRFELTRGGLVVEIQRRLPDTGRISSPASTGILNYCRAFWKASTAAGSCQHQLKPSVAELRGRERNGRLSILQLADAVAAAHSLAAGQHERMVWIRMLHTRNCAPTTGSAVQSLKCRRLWSLAATQQLARRIEYPNVPVSG